jgi:signal transduction histidine kinase
MSIKNLLLNKRNLLLLIFIPALIISGILEPIIKSNRIENWNNTLIEYVIGYENKITEVINSKVEKLIKNENELKNILRSGLEKDDIKNCFAVINENTYAEYHIQVNDENKTVCWNNKLIFEKQDYDAFSSDLGQVYFIRKDLSTYIFIADTIITTSQKYFLFISRELEKHYKLDSKTFTFSNLSDQLSKLISTNIEIDYNRAALLSKDGRKHSFNILNNYNNKIGVATFDKPSLDISIKELEETFNAVQSILILLIYLSIGIIGYKNYKAVTNKFIQFIILLLYLAIFRAMLFYLGIPSSYIHNELTDPSNFSSSFAFGVVRSPLDFFISVSGLFVVIIIGFNRLNNYLESRSTNRNAYKFTLVFIISAFFIMIIYRSVGASLRSVVFDSTIRYFKEFSLIPSPAILLMDLNILLLGFSALVISLLLLKWSFSEFPLTRFELKSALILFAVFQILGLTFDLFQVQPQGTPLIRALFIALLFLLVYLSYRKVHRGIYYVYYGIASSVIIVSLFVYYNSEIERESLKTVAYDLTRRNQNIYEFILYQSLIQSKEDDEISRYGEGEVNYSSIAFEMWNKSLLFRENIPSSVSIYNERSELLGRFSNYTSTVNVNPDKYLSGGNDQPKIYIEKNLYGSDEMLIGVTQLNGINGKKKYLVATALFNNYYLGEEVLPKFLTVTREGMTSATDYKNLKIFVFSNNSLVNSYGDVLLNSSEISELLTGVNEEINETWKRIDIKGESQLVFILRPRERNNEIIAVALEERRFAWNLSNFFKVFFVHALIILFAFLVYAVRNFGKWKEYFQSYKTKLTFAFILVSVVPLLIIAAYIRNINETKNEELLNSYLNEYAEQINSYYNKYNTASNLSLQSLFEKANRDLNINFNCYDENKLIYSTQKYFYEAGILSSTLNPDVFINTILMGGNKVFLKENSNGENYFSLYLNLGSTFEPLFININTLMNTVSIPLTDVELDIFLFGILAVALVLLIFFSTILADQISSPIRRLTHATRSIGGGDLNFEIDERASGEIGELAKGFNMMIRKLKKSQIELAQLERETAWKEMAKQVAHEIKNPLTPMKLSVQQLITAYRDKSTKFDEIFGKVTNTVINQIEALKNIASEFSSFARMPKLSIERINIIPIINETVNLFADEKGKITFKCNYDSIFVNADADHLSRAIINLVRNSLQANSTIVELIVTTRSDSCEIRIKDNGTGISPDISEKVFEDSFTTKAKGMGLGLSMARKFIESIGGDISIEKSSPEGTTFLIKIPVAG